MPSRSYAIFLFLILIGSSWGADDTKVLVGRWSAEIAPTGYWVIDRYPDGRYAKKEFASFDLNKPSEICVTWGRWKIKGRQYLEIIDGSSSAFIKTFANKWRPTEFSQIKATRFAFMTSDGEPRAETPLRDKGSLLDIPMKAPSDLSGPYTVIVTDDLNGIPKWVRQFRRP